LTSGPFLLVSHSTNLRNEPKDHNWVDTSISDNVVDKNEYLGYEGGDLWSKGGDFGGTVSPTREEGVGEGEEIFDSHVTHPNDVNVNFKKGTTLSLFKQYRDSIESKKKC